MALFWKSILQSFCKPPDNLKKRVSLVSESKSLLFFLSPMFADESESGQCPTADRRFYKLDISLSYQQETASM